jgi:micrococcal nuclease
MKIATIITSMAVLAISTAACNMQTNISDQANITSTIIRDMEIATFGYCPNGGARNCLIDGNSFWYDGRKYRLADIDAPELHRPNCDQERILGKQAAYQLYKLINKQRFSLKKSKPEYDKYGRNLVVMMQNGASVGKKLLAEGLAKKYGDASSNWCSNISATNEITDQY